MAKDFGAEIALTCEDGDFEYYYIKVIHKPITFSVQLPQAYEGG